MSVRHHISKRGSKEEKETYKIIIHFLMNLTVSCKGNEPETIPNLNTLFLSKKWLRYSEMCNKQT